jgi:hypothetical protein
MAIGLPLTEAELSADATAGPAGDVAEIAGIMGAVGSNQRTLPASTCHLPNAQGGSP